MNIKLGGSATIKETAYGKYLPHNVSGIAKIVSADTYNPLTGKRQIGLQFEKCPTDIITVQEHEIVLI